MFLMTNNQEVINLKNIKRIYVKSEGSNTRSIGADDFDNRSYCVYPIAGEGEIDDKFFELIDDIQCNETLINIL